MKKDRRRGERVGERGWSREERHKGVLWRVPVELGWRWSLNNADLQACLKVIGRTPSPSFHPFAAPFRILLPVRLRARTKIDFRLGGNWE